MHSSDPTLQDSPRAPLRTADWVIRGTLAVNALLFALSFVPSFSGVGPKPGLADRLWGDVRMSGWRADVVWMLVSSLAIFAAGLRWPVGRGPARTTAVLAWAWLPCFLVYLLYVLMHMMG